MRVEIRDHEGLVGVVELRGSRAVPDEAVRPLLDGLVVVKPGRPSRRVTPDDGEDYLLALQHALRGTYLWATAPLD